MAFRIAQKTLERLEWPTVVARLREECRSPQARQRLGDEAEADAEEASADGGPDVQVEPDTWHSPDDPAKGFESSLHGTRERLAETSEARILLDAEEFPPLGGARKLDLALRRVEMGGAAAAQQLIDVASTLGVLCDLASFLERRRERCPRLADIAETIGDHRPLAREIETCIDPSGEVSDDASPTLRNARREASRLGNELQARLARYLQNPDIKSHLSDSYYTVRNDRYVLPVKADSKGRVRGIVHDASNSGGTLFVEPEAVVELNNRLKQAELAVAREVDRVLRSLSAELAEEIPSLRASLETLVAVDLAFARGRLSQQMDAVEPIVDDEGVFELTQLRHPLLPSDEAVPNDLRLGADYSVLVISGPNAGGKTVSMKAVALAALFARAGLHVPAAPGARVDLVDAVLADIGDEQNIAESLSTFSAHMVNLAEIVSIAGPHSLVVLDEVGVGTDPAEGAALAQSILEALAKRGARVIATTHYNLLKEMAAVDARFCNASVEFDPQTLAPTYRLHVGVPGASSATAVAARMGMPDSVLERANALLDREDRRLDRMLTDLAASRAALDEEKRIVEALRAESETVRNDYRGKLERLQDRRDKLFHTMRDDLDRAFKDAHTEVAGVIRDLQRGGTGASAQQAARAREKLGELESAADETGERVGVKPRERREEEKMQRVDWRRIRVGEKVAVPGGGSGTLESLPDRRGQVRVRARNATLVLPATRVGQLAQAPPKNAPGAEAEKPRAGQRPSARVKTTDASGALQDLGAATGGGTLECDLRGMRVQQALDRVAEVMDQAAAEGHDAVKIIHGIGTGALRKAVREQLARAPYAFKMQKSSSEHGGEGVTLLQRQDRGAEPGAA